jgi:phage gp29-like protein
MADKVILYDQFSQPVELPKKPDAGAQATVAEKVDRWANSVVREVTPDLYARVMHPAAPLWEKQALCDRIYVNAHFLSIGSDRASTIGGWDWDVQPFTDRPGVKAKPDDVAVAEEVAMAMYGAQNLSAYFEHLAWGELYYLAFAETIWDPTNFVPLRFELVDGVRANWWGNQVTVFTEANSRTGESLKAGNWTIHGLNLQNPAKSRLPRANAFWHMLTTFGVVDYASLSEKYNKPIPIGYFADDSQRDALVDALMQIGEQFVGAFPVGTKVDFYQAITASKDIVEGLIKFGYDQSTKATCGHVLIVEAKPGSGTLGGHGAQMTNQKVARAVANRVADSVRQGLIRPLVWFRRGAKFLGRLPVLQFKARVAIEEKTKAESYVAWNQALEPLNLAIDGEHIREAAGVPKLVPRVVAAPAGPPPASPDANTPEAQAAEADQQAQQRAALASAQAATADRSPKIRTVTDLITTSATMRQKGERDRAKKILELARQALENDTPVEAFRNELWELYDEFDKSKDDELLTQGMIVSDAMGAADAAVRAGK